MKTPTQSDVAAQPQPERNAARSSAWRRSAVAIGLVAGGFVLGAVSLASAGGMPWQGGVSWAETWPLSAFRPWRLENVGASTAQEDKIHDIIAATYTDLDQGKTNRDALRKQVLDLMRAPTIDRAAVEKLRADQIAAFDAKSKKVVGAALDAAGQLTPEQRAKLVQQAEDRMDHRGWGGWRHGGPEDGHGGRAPDGAPDHAPDDRGEHG